MPTYRDTFSLKEMGLLALKIAVGRTNSSLLRQSVNLRLRNPALTVTLGLQMTGRGHFFVSPWTKAGSIRAEAW